MAKVKDLNITLQIGTEKTYYASWEFDESTKSSTGGSIKVGDLVTIKPGSTYYNGVAIPSWVMADSWYVMQVSGNRAVINKNKAGNHAICSPVNTNNLVKTSGASGGGGVAPNTLEHYEVEWHYDTGNGVWFEGGGKTTTKSKNALYTVPDNAIKFKVTVKPISKKYTKNNKQVDYWTGESVSKEMSLSIALPPEVPPAPSPDLKDYNLTATVLDVTDARTDKIEFEVYNDTERVLSGVATVLAQKATYSWNVPPGGKYRIRARAIYIHSSSNVYSNWTSFTAEVCTKPTAVTSAPTLKALSETSVYVSWEAVDTAETYDIEYSKEKRYFDDSNETTTVNGIENAHFEITGLESGDEYFFRVRAVNEHGESDWSDINSVTIGKAPSAPTTWSSSTTVIVGEKLILYWAHNSLDNSAEKYGEVELTIDGVTTTKTIAKSTDEDEQWETSYLEIDTSKYKEGTQILWRVRTAGVTNVYGEPSIQRTVDVYAQPTLTLTVTDSEGELLNTLTQFPFTVKALAGPKTQEPTGYHLTVIANSYYETNDNIGNAKVVNAGDEVYARYFDIKDPLDITLSAGDLDLENGITYTINCVVSMNSGLTTESSTTFNVAWTDDVYDVDAEIGIDEDSYSAYIKPYCNNEDGEPVEGVTLSVYRREFDGTFTEIATGLSNTSNTHVTDPHPSLDYARYRIVAITDNTGAVSFYDTPAYPVAAKCAVIQWDEEWTNFDVSNEDAFEQPTWTGSLLKLPYNISVSNSHAIEVGLVKYIGRKRPVAYYGTQLGETATWTLDVVKSDKETLYALRRLSIYTGDVYVREPSGSGYWANITVSFSQTQKELTIPVTLNITRVEGGV